MSTDRHQVQVAGITVDVVRKDIRNLHLGVYPPLGKVRVSAPLAVSDEAVRLAVISKLAWIKRQRAGFARQARQGPREAVTGESHYLFGKRYRLRVVAHQGRPYIDLPNKAHIILHADPAATAGQRLDVLDRWYRDHLRTAIDPLFTTWQETLGVTASFVGVKRMKTKWGSCNPATRRIWINSELAHKPLESIEFIVVHELVHLLIPNHGEHFARIMDEHLPDWRARRSALNSQPLAHESWSY